MLSWHHLQRVVACALFALLLFAACDDDEVPTRPMPNLLRNTLTFVRQDSTQIPIGTVYAVCCAVWEPGFIDKQALKILFYDPANQLGGWKLFLLPNEAARDSTYTLPTAEAGQSHVSMFVVDPNGNELNSDVMESAGSITLHSFSCGPPVRADVTVDAVLGSEFGGGPPIRVQGRLTAEIHTNPSPLGCDFSF